MIKNLRLATGWKSRGEFLRDAEEQKKKQINCDLNAMQEVMGNVGLEEHIMGMEALDLGASAIDDDDDDDDDDDFAHAIWEALNEED